MRRLITLISAGRNRIVMIRRELPRTEVAGWVGTPYRTKRRRILLSVRPRPATSTNALQCEASKAKLGRTKPAIPSWLEMGFSHRRQAPSRPNGSERERAAASRREAWTGGADARQWKWREWQASVSLGGLRRSLEFGLRSYSNRPDESQQFAANGSYDLGFVFVLGSQFFVASAETPLSFPGDGLGFFVQPLLPLGQPTSDPGFMLVGPSGFQDDSSEMRIAGFGNVSSLDAVAAGVLARDQTAIAHQLPWIRKAGQTPNFGYYRYGDDLSHPAQCLQGLYYFPDFDRGRDHGIIDRLLQKLDTIGGVFHFVHVIQKSSLQCRLCKAHLALHPVHVFLGPVLLNVFRGPATVAQQKFSQPVTGSQLILSGVFPGTQQVAQSFMGGVRHPYWRKITGAIAARQLYGIAAIRLHAVTGFHRYKGRCNHLTSHSQCRQLPIQNISGGARFVAGFQILHRPKLRQHFANRFQTVRYCAERTDLSVCFGHRYRNGVRVDIQTNKSYLRHATNSFRMRLCAAGSSESQRNPRTANRGWSPHCD